MIKITREVAYRDKIRSYYIYIDNKSVGKIKEGETKHLSIEQKK